MLVICKSSGRHHFLSVPACWKPAALLSWMLRVTRTRDIEHNNDIIHAGRQGVVWREVYLLQMSPPWDLLDVALSKCNTSLWVSLLVALLGSRDYFLFKILVSLDYTKAVLLFYDANWQSITSSAMLSSGRYEGVFVCRTWWCCCCDLCPLFLWPSASKTAGVQVSSKQGQIERADTILMFTSPQSQKYSDDSSKEMKCKI